MFKKLEVGRVTYSEDGQPADVLVFYRVLTDDGTGVVVSFRAESPEVSYQAENVGQLKHEAIPLWAATL